MNEDGDISRIIPGLEDIRDILRIWVSYPGISASLRQFVYVHMKINAAQGGAGIFSIRNAPNRLYEYGIEFLFA